MTKSRATSAANLTRRHLLQGGAVLTSAAGLCDLSLGQEAAVRSDGGTIAGMDPNNVVGEYTVRKIDQLSDADLYRQATEIVARPHRRSNGYTIHAPLELMARYGLLPLVEPDRRRLARIQMTATAAAYGVGRNSAGAPKRLSTFASLGAAKRQIAETFESRNIAGLEATVLQVANQFGTASLVESLMPLALPTMTGAAHTHIGLWLLLQHGSVAGTGDAALLRTAVRSLAKNPEQRLSSFNGMSFDDSRPLRRTPEEMERSVLRVLADAPRVVPSGRSSLAQLTAAEKSGHVDAMFGELINHDLSDEQIDAAFRAVLRVAAQSMLQDDIGQAKFGWSHCLTRPQAACGLSSFHINRKLALASTFVWTTARRCISGRVALDFDWTPKKPKAPIKLIDALGTSPDVAAARVWHADRAEWPAIIRTLATQAAIRNDQHLVKYVRACLDVTTFDPSQAKLYLASAAYLCSIWVLEHPEAQLEDNLLAGRRVR